MFVLSDRRMIAEHKAVRTSYFARAASKSSIITGKLHSPGRSAARADPAFRWGDGRLRSRGEDGAAQVDGRRRLTVWRRQSDGRSQIVRKLVF